MIGLRRGRANVRSGYCNVGYMSGQANVSRASVRGLLSGQVTVQSGYCPVGLLSFGKVSIGLLSVGSMCPWGSIFRASVWSGYCPDIGF